MGLGDTCKHLVQGILTLGDTWGGFRGHLGTLGDTWGGFRGHLGTLGVGLGNQLQGIQPFRLTLEDA